MNNYCLLAISMTFALLGGMATKFFLGKYQKGDFEIYFYNCVAALVSAIVLVLWSNSLEMSAFTLVLGVVFGSVTAIQQIFCLKAMKCGPWSYTAVISSLSTIIPTLSGCIIWGETIAPVQIAGIALMLACMCMASDLKRDGSAKTVKWMIYCGILFITTGMIGVLQKWHQNTAYKGELDGFLVVALSVSCVFAGVCAFVTKSKRLGATYFKSLIAVLPVALMILSGASAAVNNKLNLFLSGVLDSSVMFPVVNGGGLMLTTLAATFVFRERLSKKQWLGLAIGFVAVMLLCNPFSS